MGTLLGGIGQARHPLEVERRGSPHAPRLKVGRAKCHNDLTMACGPPSVASLLNTASGFDANRSLNERKDMAMTIS